MILNQRLSAKDLDVNFRCLNRINEDESSSDRSCPRTIVLEHVNMAARNCLFESGIKCIDIFIKIMKMSWKCEDDRSSLFFSIITNNFVVRLVIVWPSTGVRSIIQWNNRSLMLLNGRRLCKQENDLAKKAKTNLSCTTRKLSMKTDPNAFFSYVVSESMIDHIDSHTYYNDADSALLRSLNNTISIYWLEVRNDCLKTRRYVAIVQVKNKISPWIFLQKFSLCLFSAPAWVNFSSHASHE